MNYKELFKIAWLLISSPARAWKEIGMERDKQKVFSAFVYPMIGLDSLSVFVHSLWKTGWGSPESFQTAMVACCAVAISLFGGYFLAAYIINRLSVGMFSLENNIPLIRQFCGYALVVTFLIKIVIGFFPDFEIIGWMVAFYTIYVVWEGVSTENKPDG
ncbi:hypothetical protein EZS27_033813, partial [termite gut metagenome]